MKWDAYPHGILTVGHHVSSSDGDKRIIFETEDHYPEFGQSSFSAWLTIDQALEVVEAVLAAIEEMA